MTLPARRTHRYSFAVRYRPLRSLTTPSDVVPFVDAPQTLEFLPRTVHLELYQGDDVFLRLICTDADGLPSDLSAAVALSQIKANPYPDADVMAEFVPEIVDNVISLWLPHAQATQLHPGPAVWDAQITDTGEVTTLAAGNVTVTAEVSW